MKHLFYTLMAAVLLMAMLVMAEPMPTGYYVSIEGKQQVSGAPTATKLLKNGVIIILRDGVAYDVLGHRLETTNL